MYRANKLSQTAKICLNGSFEQVFPLFGPIREKDWADGWDPQILVSGAENIEEHMVFQTSPHSEQEQGQHYTWVVSKYDYDDGLIEYTVFADGRLWWITILCRQNQEGGSCDATITYTYVGFNELAEKRNTNAMATMYLHDLKDWEHAINHYLETGSTWRHS